ncbi:AzlD domain-containing protein [Nocardioides euryhalodurans]|uniref:AzlD domain-containing protein n=1 Tax=Nocardioides euryhalodurans TaxID=2518370 RepID=A0A4P7GNF1_9ACTN|nr:AzlD domain-containing protein [Nocardioides euryhalodurans]QBR93317.1 AzlD domain-containing protein [Nocardioides euryhalodurans]
MTLNEVQVWLLIGALTAMAVLTKALGPAFVGGRELPTWGNGVIAVSAPALLSALVVTSVLADGQQWAVGAQTVGVGVAAVMLLCRAPLLLASLVAVVVTAVLRALTG